MSKQLKLREYQTGSVEALRARIREGIRVLILSIPTGGGKTVIATHLAIECLSKPGKRVLFVADRIALIEQTSTTFDLYGIPHGVIQGNHWRTKPWERVQVASIQTIEKRGWPDADLIIVDECHTVHKTVAERIAHLKVSADERERKAIVIGLSATPITRGLGISYEAVVTTITTNELIRGLVETDGARSPYLTQYRIYAASEPDMSGAKTLGGEWTDKAAAERSMPIVGDCVEEYLRHAPGKKFIAFGCNVAHCEELQRQFEQAGVVTSMYTYKTDDESRAAMVEEFRKPDSYIRGLISVSALSKGFDVSDVEVIIMARPLKSSLAEHIQILGRGLRIHPGKAECIVLDHSGNCMRFWAEMNEFFESGVKELDDGKKKAKPKSLPKPEKEPVKCPGCAHVHMPMPSCPACGHAYKVTRSFEHQPGLLAEVAPAKGGNKKVATTFEDKAEFFTGLRFIAESNKWNPGWASHKFKEKFGDWPDSTIKAMPSAEPSKKVRGWVTSRRIAENHAKKKAVSA
ncbi:DEAD/DEAH box helicase [Massilia aquatica]|uniref:DEAD/DEAH box helicase n=1 Tax=Massilia aquatica TaxID=2609000 RepID=A0ABX0M788_9BURK|nr:DEAD/DEAH box helicase [Massilia aquatica]NHZ40097.1 DEAD/DEAH box helicase [Massilia aquatica]